LGSIPTLQWCKVHLSATFIHDVTGVNAVLAIPELDDRFLYNHSSDPGPDCGGLLGTTPATLRYNVRPEAPIPHGAIGSQEAEWIGWRRLASGLDVNLAVY